MMKFYRVGKVSGGGAPERPYETQAGKKSQAAEQANKVRAFIKEHYPDRQTNYQALLHQAGNDFKKHKVTAGAIGQAGSKIENTRSENL